jgi:hypothetical protein
MDNNNRVFHYHELAHQLHQHGYAPVPIKKGEKRPALAGWAEYKYTDRHEFNSHYTGILAKHTPAVDIDVLDEALAGELKQLALSALGPAPERVGRAPKTLLLYRTSMPFKKLKVGFKLPGSDTVHGVEILGDGQQFLAYAVHPDTGKPYVWSANDPLNSYAADLPEITAASAVEYLRKARELIERAGGTDFTLSPALRALVEPKTETKAGPNPKREGKCGRAEIVSALKRVGITDRDGWFRVACGLHHEYQGSDDGFELFDEWSAAQPGYEGTDDCRKTWDSIKNDTTSGTPITIGTVFQLAMDNGWKGLLPREMPWETGQYIPLPKSAFPATRIKEGRDGKQQTVLDNDCNNIDALLKGYGIELWFCEIRKKAFWTRPDVKENDNLEVLYSTVIGLCDRNGLKTSSLSEHLNAVAMLNARNPVLEYLEALPAWDGIDRFPALAARMKPACENTATTALRLWFVQACAAADMAVRAMERNPEVTRSFGYVLALQGAQGIGKTRGLLRLVPEDLRHLVSDGAHLALSNKDSVLGALSNWICEPGEIATTFGRSAIDELKAFLTRSTDNIRMPYGRAYRSLQRCTVFAGSVNDHEFLRDATGNRRYWVVPVETMELRLTSEEVEKLWGQAWALYCDGRQWWPNAEEEERLSAAAEEARERSVEEELLERFFDWSKAAEAGNTRWTVVEIHSYITSQGIEPRSMINNRYWSMDLDLEPAKSRRYTAALQSLWRKHGRGIKGRKVYTPGGTNRGWLLPPDRLASVKEEVAKAAQALASLRAGADSEECETVLRLQVLPLPAALPKS